MALIFELKLRGNLRISPVVFLSIKRSCCLNHWRFYEDYLNDREGRLVYETCHDNPYESK